MISQSGVTNLLPQVIIVSFILAFNGFSVQAQVASIIADTDIRFAPYFFARILHGVIASVLALLLFKPLYVNKQAIESPVTPVFSQIETIPWVTMLENLQQLGPLITITSIGLAVLILIYRTLSN